MPTTRTDLAVRATVAAIGLFVPGSGSAQPANVTTGDGPANATPISATPDGNTTRAAAGSKAYETPNAIPAA